MKIALCLSGQPRYFEKGYQSIKKAIIDGNDVDVFIHTWHDPIKIDQKFDVEINNNNREVIFQKNLIDKIIMQYNPKKILYEAPKFFSYPDEILPVSFERPEYSCKEWRNRYLSAMYSLYRSNLLKTKYELDNNFNYDWVVKCRFDLNIHNKINFSNYDNNKYYINQRPHVELDDRIAFSSSEKMDYYSDMYLYAEKYVMHGIAPGMHSILTAHLKSKEIFFFTPYYSIDIIRN